jgi:hypothetical protein
MAGVGGTMGGTTRNATRRARGWAIKGALFVMLPLSLSLSLTLNPCRQPAPARPRRRRLPCPRPRLRRPPRLPPPPRPRRRRRPPRAPALRRRRRSPQWRGAFRAPRVAAGHAARGAGGGVRGAEIIVAAAARGVAVLAPRGAAHVAAREGPPAGLTFAAEAVAHAELHDHLVRRTRRFSAVVTMHDHAIGVVTALFNAPGFAAHAALNRFLKAAAAKRPAHLAGLVGAAALHPLAGSTLAALWSCRALANRSAGVAEQAVADVAARREAIVIAAELCRAPRRRAAAPSVGLKPINLHGALKHLLAAVVAGAAKRAFTNPLLLPPASRARTAGRAFAAPVPAVLFRARASHNRVQVREGDRVTAARHAGHNDGRSKRELRCGEVVAGGLRFSPHAPAAPAVSDPSAAARPRGAAAAARRRQRQRAGRAQ